MKRVRTSTCVSRLDRERALRARVQSSVSPARNDLLDDLLDDFSTILISGGRRRGGGGAGRASSASPTTSSGKRGLACAGIFSERAARSVSISRRASTREDFQVARWSSRCVESDSIRRRVEAGSAGIVSASPLGASRGKIRRVEPPIIGRRRGPSPSPAGVVAFVDGRDGGP
jgi:hypothetical protein